MATQDGLVKKEPVVLKSGMEHKKKKEDGMEQSQKLLLTWLIDMPGLYPQIQPYIHPEDFTQELYRRTAEMLFAQFEEGKVNPAQLISRFSDEEEQREVTSLFHARIHEVQSRQDQEKAIKETVLRIKKAGMEKRKKELNPTDITGLQKLVEDRKNLQEMEKINIQITDVTQ